MNRISITLPQYLQDSLTRSVPNGQISKFVSDAIEAKLIQTQTRLDPVDDYFKFAAQLPSVPFLKIKKAIAKGRV